MVYEKNNLKNEVIEKTNGLGTGSVNVSAL